MLHRSIKQIKPGFLVPIAVTVLLMSFVSPASIKEDHGTPYFNENFRYATIVMGKGRSFKNKMRINLVTLETTFVADNGIEANIGAGIVKEISYTDTTDEGIKPYYFKTGYPPVDRLSRNQFYLVLADGKCSFLKAITKEVTEKENHVNNTRDKYYETKEEWYIFINGAIKRWKKDKDILADFPDKQDQLNGFAETNKINFRKEDQVIQLIKYYNSLQ